MRKPEDDTSALETAVKNCYSTWGESYYRDYYESNAAYPPVHTGIVRDALQEARARTVLDAGCGPASMLRDLNGLNLDRYGFDLTPEMVVEARRVMVAQGVPESHIWHGSVLDERAFDHEGSPNLYDAAICFGVLPHIPAAQDAVVLRNLTRAVKKGGLVMVEARNQLFALFTLNRYSRDFFVEQLIRLPEVQRAAREEEKDGLDRAFRAIEERFRMDLPPVRKGKAGEPGYDEVLSRTHNPFELRVLAEEAGLTEVSVLFYHYHCMPPMAEALMPQLFRRASVAREDPRDWRGHFMASAFIITGRRA